MDRDAGGGYRMTFATPGAPPRTAKVVRAVGSRRYQQYLAAEGDTLWRLPVAYHIEEKRWFPMTGAFLFSDDATIDDRRAAALRGRRVRPPRHALERQLRLLPQRRAQSRARSVDGRVRDDGRRAGDRLRGLPRPGRGARARQRRPVAPLRACTSAPRADPTIVNPSRLSPARAADICAAAATASGSPPTSVRSWPTAIRSSPGDDLARYSRPLGRDTPLRGDASAFARALLGGRHAAADRLRIPGPAAVARARSKGGLTCTSCHGMHEGDPRGQIRARFAGANADQMCTQCHARAGRAGRASPRTRTTIRRARAPAASAATCRASCTACSTSTAATASRSRSPPRADAARRRAPGRVHPLSRRGPRRAGEKGPHAVALAGHVRPGRARGRRRCAGPRAVVRRRRARASPRGRCSGAWPTTLIRRSATSPGGACAD